MLNDENAREHEGAGSESFTLAADDALTSPDGAALAYDDTCASKLHEAL